ncbi:hypothetical protein STPYR_12665 [uncultured Stenotrophomonas sp.]|uniref:Uncharacterized protein n=1 Tax=uncultured Stenotrophomonas sp. TaxID=165438 RepID=A0A1Y5Q5Z3_9GAMM|nr:hypothetical protein STPYR_12665 [uncultured Stenotrophomonas sp.]
MGEVATTACLSADSGRLATVSGQRTLLSQLNSFDFKKMRFAHIVRKETLPPGKPEH